MFGKGLILAVMDFLKFVPDEPYLKFLYKIRTGKKLRLHPPVTFNEKLQWLKIHDHNPEYSRLADKAEVKKYIAQTIGPEYVIPQLGIWDRAEDIDFDSLPQQFVLKCTHDSGSIVICKDKNNFDKAKAVKVLSKAVKRNFYNSKREWAYKGLKGRIIAEKYMEDHLVEGQASDEALSDYKLFCFNGEPKTVFVVRGGHGDESKTQRRMYDTDWNLLHAGFQGKAPITEPEERPKQLKEMLELAKKLSKGIPFVRVDFYIINEKIYFGEMTFFHMSGCGKFTPDSFDKTLGDMLSLDLK